MFVVVLFSVVVGFFVCFFVCWLFCCFGCLVVFGGGGGLLFVCCCCFGRVGVGEVVLFLSYWVGGGNRLTVVYPHIGNGDTSINKQQQKANVSVIQLLHQC